MTYRALARKYRSQHFGELIGQDVLVRTLSNAIEKNRLHHAYLFTGIRGTGKTSTARILAKAINYAGKDGSKGPTTGPTDDCAICNAITGDNHPDVIEIDAASNTGVEEVRQIIENARYAPMQARYKVFIIDEVHMLSKSAFNALLKTLEEPPAHVVFMMATTEIRRVPVTILSRCQRFDLRRVEANTLMAHYKKIADLEKITIDDEALQIIARAADGSVRDGLSLLDQAIAQASDQPITGTTIRAMLGQGDRDGIATLITSMLNGDIAPALDTLQALHQSGTDPMALLDDLLDGVHLITRLKIKPDLSKDPTLSPRLRDVATKLAPAMQISHLSRVWQMLLKAVPEVAQASQPIQALEMALIRICFAATLPPLEDLAKRGPGTDTNAQGAVVTSPAPSPAPAAQMRVVSTNRAAAPAPRVEAVAALIPQAATMQIADLRALVALCEEKNEPMLAADLYANAQLVKMQQGQIELVPAKGASKDFISVLGKKLNEWTGQRWIVAVATGGGQPSLHAQDMAQKNIRIDAAYNDKAISPWKKHFPDMKITDLE
jgi:DNA polymerase-3 subunit gamma/tau